MPSSAIGVDIKESGNLDELLGRVELLMREKALKSAMRKSLEPARKRTVELCPTGGPRINTKSGKKHLYQTYKATVRQYGGTVVGVMGAEYPAGAHSHLVEFGHDVVRDGKVVGRAAPKPHVRPGVEQTQSQQRQAFEQELSRMAAEASK